MFKDGKCGQLGKTLDFGCGSGSASIACVIAGVSDQIVSVN
jgi:precorrin-6B methylase 2